MLNLKNQNPVAKSGALTKRTIHVEQEPGGDRGDTGMDGLMKLPPWLTALRDAMGGAIKADDLSEIMAVQVKMAKEGNMQAAQFVMGQAHKMLQAGQKRITVVQNNYYDTPTGKRPDTPLEPDDGKEQTLGKLSARASAGLPTTGGAKDRRVRPISDEEEKEIRRRQAGG